MGGLLKPGLPARQLRDRVLQLAVHRPDRPRPGRCRIREKEFVEAAPVARGVATAASCSGRSCRTWLAPIIVYTTLIIPNNILFEAALSFLGLGVPQHDPVAGGGSSPTRAAIFRWRGG